MKHLEAATKTASPYSAGSTVAGHYNPDDPSHSNLTPGPNYSIFLKAVRLRAFFMHCIDNTVYSNFYSVKTNAS